MSDRSSEQAKGEQQMDQSDNLAHAFAGAGGGLLSMALTYPLITLSTRGQVEKKKAKGGTYAAAKRIVDREGIIGLYAGMESALLRVPYAPTRKRDGGLYRSSLRYERDVQQPSSA